MTVINRIVQNKVFFLRSVVFKTPISEKILSEAFACGRFQETGGYDLVGIDIFDGKGYGRTVERGEFFHVSSVEGDGFFEVFFDVDDFSFDRRDSRH